MVLFLATMVLWIRSYWIVDRLEYWERYSTGYCQSVDGSFALMQRESWNPSIRTTQYLYVHFPADPQSPGLKPLFVRFGFSHGEFYTGPAKRAKVSWSNFPNGGPASAFLLCLSFGLGA